jgi:hypothetical protein
MFNQSMDFLNNNRAELTELYLKGLEEKEAIKKRLLCCKRPDESILKEFTKIDNLVKSVARVVYSD